MKWLSMIAFLAVLVLAAYQAVLNGRQQRVLEFELSVCTKQAAVIDLQRQDIAAGHAFNKSRDFDAALMGYSYAKIGISHDDFWNHMRHLFDQTNLPTLPLKQ